MAIIENIEVEMTFSVGLGGYEASNEVIQELKEIEEKGITLTQRVMEDYPNAMEWLNANIHSKDAYSWEYEVSDLETK